MNELNYCTIPAAQRLHEAGIVLETDFYHVRHHAGGYYKQVIIRKRDILGSSPLTHPASIASARWRGSSSRR